MSYEQTPRELFYYQRLPQSKNTVGYQHYHNFFEIYFLEAGKCHYFIDNDTYDVKAGDIVLIPKGIIHKTLYGDSAVRRLIHCSDCYIPREVVSAFSSTSYIYRNEELTKQISAFFDVIEKEYNSTDAFSQSAIMCISCATRWHAVQALSLQAKPEP